jgi:hypothetical protein
VIKIKGYQQISDFFVVISPTNDLPPPILIIFVSKISKKILDNTLPSPPNRNLLKDRIIYLN